MINRRPLLIAAVDWSRAVLAQVFEISRKDRNCGVCSQRRRDGEYSDEQVSLASKHPSSADTETIRVLLKSAMVHGYRYGEDGRREPGRKQEVWDGFMELVNQGGIEPVLYKARYDGLDSVGHALENVRMHRTWGRAVVTIDGNTAGERKARL
jgi:hypothetical protein